MVHGAWSTVCIMEHAAWSVERSERSRRRVRSPRAQALINQSQSRMNRHRLLSLLLLLPPHLTSPHPPHLPHLTARQVLRCMLSLSFPSFSTYPALFSLCSCCSPPASIASSVLCFIADRRPSPSLDSPHLRLICPNTPSLLSVMNHPIFHW